MRKKLLVLLFTISCFLCEVHGESYVVMNGNDGTISEEAHMHESQSVASISKIMTAIIAIEQGNLHDEWQVSDAILQANGSSIYLQVGQKVNLEMLLYGLLLRSGNDAAIEIAVHVAGSEPAFVQMMNEKALELGMKDTLFRNASGLDEIDGGNISSAYDMALLMRYCMNNEVFQNIVGSKYYDNEQIRWKNKNKLLFTYDATTGGKTGYTKKAGRTLITTASQDHLNSIVVTLNMGDDFHFHQLKHEQLFDQYTSYALLKQGTYHIQGITFTIPETIYLALPKDQETAIQVHSYIEQDSLKIEVIKDGVSQFYECKGSSDQKRKGGLFS